MMRFSKLREVARIASAPMIARHFGKSLQLAFSDVVALAHRAVRCGASARETVLAVREWCRERE
jgi:hypothetical protein